MWKEPSILIKRFQLGKYERTLTPFLFDNGNYRNE